MVRSLEEVCVFSVACPVQSQGSLSVNGRTLNGSQDLPKEQLQSGHKVEPRI